jgi:chemotaxis protein methyltransferase CheR
MGRVLMDNELTAEGFSEQEFSYIAKLVNDYAGIDLPTQKTKLVDSRLSRRMRELNIKTHEEYIAFVEANKEQEIPNMINAITTNVTKFFREKHHLDHLSSILLDLINNSAEKRIRIWSAGCSTGQEPYSIAMTVAEHISAIKQKNIDIKILATDIDTEVLAKASAAIYDKEDQKDIPLEYVNKYCVSLPNEKFEIASCIKDLVSFKPLNLMDQWPISGKFDIIFCRNVVIYFNKDTQKVLFSRFAQVSHPKAYLFIGHSENLQTISNDYKLIGRTTYIKNSG